MSHRGPIPAVINVTGAMHFIQDGQTIEVDGLSGRVYVDQTWPES